jgi:hypothetical protein
MDESVKKVLGAVKIEWVNQPSIIIVVEKAIKAHGEMSADEFKARLKRMGPIGRAGLSVSLETQIAEEKSPERLANLQAVMETVKGYHD